MALKGRRRIPGFAVAQMPFVSGIAGNQTLPATGFCFRPSDAGYQQLNGLVHVGRHKTQIKHQRDELRAISDLHVTSICTSNAKLGELHTMGRKHLH